MEKELEGIKRGGGPLQGKGRVREEKLKCKSRKEKRGLGGSRRKG